MSAVSLLWRGLLDLLWPGRLSCCLCRLPVPESPDPMPVCAGCLEAAGFPAGMPLCPVCSRPTVFAELLCPDCAAGVPFAGVAALGLHRPPLARAVSLLKYQGRPQVARPLGRRLADRVRERWPDLPFAAVVPLPLHRRRLLQRGYNQAQEVAEAVAAGIGLPVQAGWLRRVRPTRQQARLSRGERLQNLAGAFRAELPRLARGGILLVDDVLTTGATVCAAAAALREAGAERVGVAVLSVSTLPVW